MIIQAQELRCLLQEWEKRSEDYREQLNEAMLDQERLSNDVEQMAQDNARSVISCTLMNLVETTRNLLIQL